MPIDTTLLSGSGSVDKSALRDGLILPAAEDIETLQADVAALEGSVATLQSDVEPIADLLTDVEDLQTTAAGLGDLAVRDTVDNSVWLGAQLTIGHGGTGATTAADARTNLGLGSASTLPATAFGGTLINSADAVAARAALGVSVGGGSQVASTDITDSTAVGRSVLTAADAVAGRSALGAAPAADPQFTGSVKVGAQTFVIEIDGDTFTSVNAYWDGANWQRVDTGKVAWLMQQNVSQNMIWESYPATTYWTCQPGANPVGAWASVGGWEMVYSYSRYRDFTVGGGGCEYDGHGTVTQFGYGRFQHATIGGVAKTSIMNNAFLDESSRDTPAQPSWQAGFVSDGTTDYYHIARAPGGGSLAWSDLLTMSSSGALTLNGATVAVRGFGSAPQINLSRAGGSSGSPTDVVSGNSTLYLDGRGYYSGAYRISGMLQITVDGTPSGGTQVPGRFTVSLSDGSSAAAEKLRLTKDGQLGVGFAGAPGAALHVEAASDPELRLRETGANASSRARLAHLSDTQVAIEAYNGSTGGVSLDLNPRTPGDTTAAARVRLFRDTTSTGTRALDIHRGDGSNTIDHQLRSGGSGTSSYLNGQGGRLGICLDNPSCVLDIGGQDAVWLTTGTTAERPSSPQAGMIRCNSDLGRMETYQHGLWSPVGTGMVLLAQTVVSSSVGSVAFTSLQGFDHLMLVVYGARPSVSANLCLQVATGVSGNTWQNTNYDFQWSVRLGGGSAWTYGSVSSSNVFRVSDTTNVDNHNHGVVYLSTCGNTRPKIARADFISWHPTNGLSRSLHEGIWHNPSGLTVTGVQFWYDGGSTDITAGTFSLYGVA